MSFGIFTAQCSSRNSTVNLINRKLQIIAKECQCLSFVSSESTWCMDHLWHVSGCAPRLSSHYLHLTDEVTGSQSFCNPPKVECSNGIDRRLNKLQAIDHTSAWNFLISGVSPWSILMLFPWFPLYIQNKPAGQAQTSGQWELDKAPSGSHQYLSWVSCKGFYFKWPNTFPLLPPHRQICWLHYSDNLGGKGSI